MKVLAAQGKKIQFKKGKSAGGPNCPVYGGGLEAFSISGIEKTNKKNI